MKQIPFRDVGGPEGLPEDERIKMIGQQAMLGKVVGFIVEEYGDDGKKGEKGDRYISKLKEKFPQLIVTFRGHLVGEGEAATELIKIQIPQG